MFGAIHSQQLFSEQQLASKLTSPYASTLPAAPTPPPMSFTPWLIGGALLGGALYLFFRD